MRRLIGRRLGDRKLVGRRLGDPVEAMEQTTDAAFETEASRRWLSPMLSRMSDIQYFS